MLRGYITSIHHGIVGRVERSETRQDIEPPCIVGRVARSETRQDTESP